MTSVSSFKAPASQASASPKPIRFGAVKINYRGGKIVNIVIAPFSKQGELQLNCNKIGTIDSKDLEEKLKRYAKSIQDTLELPDNTEKIKLQMAATLLNEPNERAVNKKLNAMKIAKGQSTYTVQRSFLSAQIALNSEKLKAYKDSIMKAWRKISGSRAGTHRTAKSDIATALSNYNGHGLSPEVRAKAIAAIRNSTVDCLTSETAINFRFIAK